MKNLPTISACLVTTLLMTSMAFAQQAMKGVVTGIDELAGTISIQQIASSAVGAGGAATDSYKVQDGLLFNAVHLGDKVAVSVATIDGAKTITQLDKQ